MQTEEGAASMGLQRNFKVTHFGPKNDNLANKMYYSYTNEADESRMRRFSWIDRHKYSESDVSQLQDTRLFAELLAIYEKEAPEFLLEKGFPQEVRTSSQARDHVPV